MKKVSREIFLQKYKKTLKRAAFRKEIVTFAVFKAMDAKNGLAFPVFLYRRLPVVVGRRGGGGKDNNRKEKEMTRNIIFDLAGVILNLDLERDTKALLGVGLPDFAGCVGNKGIVAAMMPYLNGLTTQDEFLSALRPFCREGVSDDDILWAMDAVLDDVPRSRVEMLLELRKKYRVFLLSNIYEKAWQHTVGQFAIHGRRPEDCFDRLFLSYEMQLAKPDPRIFRRVIDETGIVPEETLYFDDTRENIEAGRALGLQARLVKMNCLEEALPALL